MLTSSLDYLISATKLLSTTEYQSRATLHPRIAAFNKGSPLLVNGLVEVKQVSEPRVTYHYRLVKPYDELVVSDFITPDYPQSPFLRQLMNLCADKPLRDIDHLSPEFVNPKSPYSEKQLLGLLNCLDVYDYTPVWEDFVRATSDPYRILHDMQTEGIVVRSPKRGYGYRLAMGLSRLRINTLLPYLYAKGKGKEYRNRLLYLARFHPVSTLVDKP